MSVPVHDGSLSTKMTDLGGASSTADPPNNAASMASLFWRPDGQYVRLTASQYTSLVASLTGRTRCAALHELADGTRVQIDASDVA